MEILDSMDENLNGHYNMKIFPQLREARKRQTILNKLN